MNIIRFIPKHSNYYINEIVVNNFNGKVVTIKPKDNIAIYNFFKGLNTNKYPLLNIKYGDNNMYLYDKNDNIYPSKVTEDIYYRLLKGIATKISGSYLNNPCKKVKYE